MPVYTSRFPPVELREVLLSDYLLGSQDKFPAQYPSFIDPTLDRTLTRAQVIMHADVISKALQDIRANDESLDARGTVTLLSMNTILYPSIVLGAVKAGLVIAFANATSSDHELCHIVEDSQSSHILAHSTLAHVAVKAFENLGLDSVASRKRIILTDDPLTESDKSDVHSLFAGMTSLWSSKQIGSQVSESTGQLAAPNAHDTAFLFYSSGTTGPSKGVIISHFNVTSIIEQCNGAWDGYAHGEDVILGVIPFSHVYGGIILWMFSFYTGIPVVVMPKFDPVLFLSCIPKYKVTSMLIVPPILNFLARHPIVDNFDLSTLKTILVGGAPLGQDTVQAATQRLSSQGCSIVIAEALGLTEASGSTTVLPVRLARQGKTGVGLLLPNMEARIVGDDGQDVSSDTEAGELWIRGPNIARGYLNKLEDTQKMFVDGWLCTGDIVSLDSDGCFQVTDRKKELIKYKGFQVPPAELEKLLCIYPGVSDACVIGVYSQEKSTELPRAYIQVDSKTKVAPNLIEDLDLFIRERVAPYKYLRGGIYVVDVIPRSTSGKILRKEVKDKYLKPESLREVVI